MSDQLEIFNKLALDNDGEGMYEMYLKDNSLRYWYAIRDPLINALKGYCMSVFYDFVDKVDRKFIDVSELCEELVLIAIDMYNDEFLTYFITECKLTEQKRKIPDFLIDQFFYALVWVSNNINGKNEV